MSDEEKDRFVKRLVITGLGAIVIGLCTAMIGASWLLAGALGGLLGWQSGNILDFIEGD